MIELALLVLVDAAVWILLSVAVGVAAGFVPHRLLAVDSSLTRIRGWEDGGRYYQRRFQIKRWKDALPESNRLGPGERRSKSSLTSRHHVATFVAETRRAEYVHWTLTTGGLVFWAWNPPWLATVMTVFGVAFNAPFIMVQRFNRARVRRSGPTAGRGR